MRIILFSPNHSPRLDYVLKVIFEHINPHPYECLYDEKAYLRSSGAKINYSKAPIDPTEVWINPETLLFETNLASQPVQVKWVDGCPWLHFGEKNNGQLPADVFASSFYLLSRYEEYLPFTPDRHGRFTAANSLAQREGFLQFAVVQRWVRALFQALQAQHSEFQWQPLAYHFAPTYDVDMPWLFCHRPWWKQVGGALKDLVLGKIQRLQHRWKAWGNPHSDPFYTFEQLMDWHNKYNLNPRFFFLLGDASTYDTNPSYHLPAQQALIRELAALYPVGIHPSYLSNAQPARIQMEKDRLEKIVDLPITDSRQHFLKLRFPETYRRLIAAGIQVDYSMGYADDTGFRAGTGVPFPWYDLEQEECSALMIHPFVAMDVTLQQYLGLHAEEALARIKDLHQEVSSSGGPLCLLWHNSSFYGEAGWVGWKEMYEEVLRLCGRGG